MCPDAKSIIIELSGVGTAPVQHESRADAGAAAPSPPIKSFPIKSPWVRLSGRLPIKFNWHENSHPL